MPLICDCDGFGELTLRERLFAEAIVAGYTQREAARQAGVSGSNQVVDTIAYRLARSPRVKRVLGQAWLRSGVSMARTLAHAAELETSAFYEASVATTAEARHEAFRRWIEAATLIASVHGRVPNDDVPDRNPS
jgi:hypothetical protein